MDSGREFVEVISPPAAGIVIAVLVDRQTADPSIAAKIAGELAAATERWALVAR